MYFSASISSTTKLLKPLLVFAFCMAAGLAGLTQITQHRSHPIDVYVGYVIGAGIGVYLVSENKIYPDKISLESRGISSMNFPFQVISVGNEYL